MQPDSGDQPDCVVSNGAPSTEVETTEVKREAVEPSYSLGTKIKKMFKEPSTGQMCPYFWQA